VFVEGLLVMAHDVVAFDIVAAGGGVGHIGDGEELVERESCAKNEVYRVMLPRLRKNPVHPLAIDIGEVEVGVGIAGGQFKVSDVEVVATGGVEVVHVDLVVVRNSNI
jgi:hypothetical protein